MKRLFILAGFHKTGTSSVQRILSTLHDQEKLKENPSLHYFEAGRMQNWVSHSGVVYDLLANNRESLRKMQEEAKLSRSETGVISSEDFSYLFSCGVLQETIDAFTDLDVHLVYFVRAHDKWIESMYNEDVKRMRVNCEISDYIQSKINSFSFLRAINFSERFIKKENIHVFIFDPKTFSSNIMDLLGVGDIWDGQTPWDNPSLSVNCVELLRHMSMEYPELVHNVEMLIDNLYRLQGHLGLETDLSFMSSDHNAMIFNHYFEESIGLSELSGGPSIPFWTPRTGLFITQSQQSRALEFMKTVISGDIKGMG
ncbi:sulfotransferase [Acetobacter malorum]|nr:sulfotransferase [Acetobacter malorum]KXV10776.1 hypothetical protein AD930_01055 [Acetobacter malorum]